MLQTEAIAGKHAGNGVFFRKDLASGTIVCPYEGRQIKPSEADEQAKRSRFVYQDRSGTTVDGDPDLSYGPTINDGVNFFWDNVKIQKKSDGKLYVVTTKAVESIDEALLPYVDGWRSMLPLLTADFRNLVIDRYNYPEGTETTKGIVHFAMDKESKAITPLHRTTSEDEEEYGTDRSFLSSKDSDSEAEGLTSGPKETEIKVIPDTTGGQQIRLFVTYTLPDKTSYVAMMKDRKGWMFPMGNYQEDVKQAATAAAQQRLRLIVGKDEWEVISGGETSLLGLRSCGDFLPPIGETDGNEPAAVWIPVETALKIIHMPKVVSNFHADQRVFPYCEQWFPKLAKRAIGVTPAQRAEQLAKAREIIAAESKDIKWLQKMVQKKPKAAPYLKRVLAESRTKRTSEKKAAHSAKMTNTKNTSIAWYDPAIDGDLYQDITFDGEEIVRDWFKKPEDDISGLEEEFTGRDTSIGRPANFPEDLWRYVEDSQKQFVPERWAKFTPERQQQIVKELVNLDVCKERPKQEPYVRAQAHANADAMFQPDENNPMLIKGYEMRILTTTDAPQLCKRQQSFTYKQQAFLRVKTPRLIRSKILEMSESPYRAPLLLVEYVDRVREFMAKHGDNATQAMMDPACEDMIAGFYRLCVDLRLLNAVTVSDAHPMPKVIDIFNEFAGSSHFTAFDVTDAFWSVCLAVQDRHKTAFCYA